MARSTCWAWPSASRPILQASTSEVYGDPEVHPQAEGYWGNVNPIGVRSCYDEGKRCAETLFFDYHRQHKLRIKVARIFNTYGPRMHPNDGRVVSNFIVQALKGEAAHRLWRRAGRRAPSATSTTWSTA
jgi:UDP-glucuronate decarboxylase